MSFHGLEDLKPDKYIMTYVFTFGSGQKWQDHYYVIKAYDDASARNQMQEIFGSKWSMMYKATSSQTAEEAAGVRKYNLKRLSLDVVKETKARENAIPKEFNPIEGVY